MEMLSIILTLIQMCWSLVVFLKLHIVFIPMAFIELCGISGALANSILIISILLWLVTVAKSILSLFK